MSAEVGRIRTELVDAGIAAAVQVVIAFTAWRIWVLRARRRRR